MYTKRCAVQPDLRADGQARVRRCVTQDLKRYLVIENALVTFGHGSRDIRIDVVVTGLDIDDMLPVLETGDVVMATMEISEDGAYRLTNAAVDTRAHHAHRTAA